MIFKASIYLFCLIILSSCSSLKKDIKASNIDEPAKTTQVNIVANFSLVSFTGGSYIKIKNNTLNFYLVRNGKTEKKRFILSQKDIINLEIEFKALKVNTWEKEYSDSKVPHGLLWTIQYHSKDMNINSKGYGSFPKNFNEMTSYISNTLLKDSKFEY